MLDRPIFLIGAGRSGSTAFFRLLSKHPELAWLTGICNKFPNQIGFNRLMMQVLDIPRVGDEILQRYKLGGGEVYDFWRLHVPGFDQPKHDLLAADASPMIRQDLPKLLAKTLTPRRQRFMTKLTGWPRVGFLNTIFPDALFIHVARDGRAVANSYLNVDFWRGWEGPDSWRWGPLTPEQEARWNAYGRSPVGLAGLNWEILMEAAEKGRALVSSDRFMEVRYESLCANPERVFREALEFCDLSWHPRFQPFMAAATFRNTNEKYKTALDKQDQVVLEEIIDSSLKRFGYAP